MTDTLNAHGDLPEQLKRKQPDTLPKMDKLRGHLVARRITISMLARKLQLSPAAMIMRFNGRTDWRLAEVRALARVLRLTPAEVYDLLIDADKDLTPQ